MFHLGNEVRDASFNALKIKQEHIKDFFDFGSYDGYGNFIPLISYYFLIFFKNSFLIHILPSAIVGVLSILSTYLVARIWGGRRVAIMA